MAKTAWERAKDWWKRNFGTPDPPPPPAEEFYNPYTINVGKDTLTVDMLDIEGLTFREQAVTEYKLNIGKKKFHYTDYECQSTGLQGSNPVNIVVRVYPHETPGREFQVLVLKQWDSLDYDEGFKGLLSDEQFNTTVDGEIEASFWRINDVKTPYQVQVKRLTRNGESVDTETQEVWVWDWWRETKDEGGSDYKEFLFVNWDKGDTGRFTIWRGEEVVSSSVHLFRS